MTTWMCELTFKVYVSIEADTRYNALDKATDIGIELPHKYLMGGFACDLVDASVELDEEFG